MKKKNKTLDTEKRGNICTQNIKFIIIIIIIIIIFYYYYCYY